MVGATGKTLRMEVYNADAFLADGKERKNIHIYILVRKPEGFEVLSRVSETCGKRCF